MRVDAVYVYGEVTKDDHARVRRIATQDRMSQSDFVRMCINDWFEAVGEPPLEEIKAREYGSQAVRKALV